MNLKRKTAVTLTELLVATVVIGVVMLGIGSVEVAMRQTHTGSSRNAIVSMNNSAVMLHISRNAERATGDKNNLGIDVSNPNNLWIRTEDPANPTPDPSTYADDIWLSYTFNVGTSKLFFCAIGDNPTQPPTTTCTNTDEVVGSLTAFTATLQTDDTTGIQTFYLEIVLENRFDPTQPADIFDNPERTLQSRVYPGAHSF